MARKLFGYVCVALLCLVVFFALKEWVDRSNDTLKQSQNDIHALGGTYEHE